jgi:arylsulfatase
MATCVAVSGAEYPKERDGQAIQPLEGKSLVPAFDGQELEREAIYWEHEGNRAIRIGNWKLVAKGPAGVGSRASAATARTATWPASSPADAADDPHGKAWPIDDHS